MDNPEQVGLLAVGIIKLVTYLVFLTLYVIRINKLDKLASNSIEKDRSLKFRVAGIGILIALDAIHIILSYSDPYYYMAPYANFTLIGILVIFDLVLQIYIITRQHKKMTSHKSRSVVMLWIFIACQQISTIVIVEYYLPNTGIVLSIFKVIVSSVLIILTFLIEPPAQSNIQQLQSNIQEPRLPILSQTGSIYEKNTENIYVEFNKEFQVSVQKEYFQFSFKIAVYVCGKFHIITKSQSEFVNFSHEMMLIFPNCETVCIKDTVRLKNSLNITKCGQQKQKSYQAYLIQLTKTMQFYCEPLMNFLQIGDNFRTVLQKKKGSVLLKKQSLNSDQQQKHKRPFFTVSYKDDKIHISNYQILQLYLNKSKSEIVSFYHKLISEKRLRIQLLSDQADEHQILHFIFRVANSKYLWRYFAEWMCLGSIIQEKIFNMFDFWNLGFENLDINVIGYETSFDKSNSVIYLYLISIHNKSVNKETIVVKKRFNDFVKLDRNIRKFIVTENIKNVNLPNLPPKFSPFESKTSPNSRRVYFDNYIKDIVKIQGINHCIKLLQFLEINNEMMSHSQSHGEEMRENQGRQHISVGKQKSRSGSGSGPNSLQQYEENSKRIRGGSQIFESIRVDDLAIDR